MSMGIFVHLWNPINKWQIKFVVIWIYSKGSDNRFVVVLRFWCRKTCKIVCRVPRKRVKSKLIYQSADVITLADKCIVVRSFACRNYDKVFVETGKFSDNLRVTENGLVSGVDRAFKSSNSTFQNICDRLNPLGKSVELDILFLGPPSGIQGLTTPKRGTPFGYTSKFGVFEKKFQLCVIIIPWKWIFWSIRIHHTKVQVL